MYALPPVTAAIWPIVTGSGGTGTEFVNAPNPNVTLPVRRAERDRIDRGCPALFAIFAAWSGCRSPRFCAPSESRTIAPGAGWPGLRT